MWEDDRIWLPMLLREEPFHGRFLFDDDLMLDHEMLALPPSVNGAKPRSAPHTNKTMNEALREESRKPGQASSNKEQ